MGQITKRASTCKRPNIANAIAEINSSAIFSYTDEDINSIVWGQGTTPISTTTIQNKINELQTIWDSKAYIDERNYPSIQEQLDMQYWDKVNNTNNWQSTIAAIKNNAPKS
jgi:hypothetical protein